MAKTLDQVSTLEMSDSTLDAGSVLSFIQNPAMHKLSYLIRQTSVLSGIIKTEKDRKEQKQEIN